MKNYNYKRMPNSLKRYRKAKGLKQKEVAEILGLKSSSIISRWEKGFCLPSLLNAFKLALLYGTMVDALFIDLRKTTKGELHKMRKKLSQGTRQ
jgi:transcriptional regulator with XRE-family HTH domain